MYKNELEAVVEQRMDELIKIDKNNNVNVFFSSILVRKKKLILKIKNWIIV